MKLNLGLDLYLIELIVLLITLLMVTVLMAMILMVMVLVVMVLMVFGKNGQWNGSELFKMNNEIEQTPE
jgi:hypothetical protein